MVRAADWVVFAVACAAPAAVLSALLAPLARRAALVRDFVAPARPDRLHREAVPYGGGVAILASVAAVTAAGWLLLAALPPDRAPCSWVPWEIADNLAPHVQVLKRLAVGTGLFFLLGLIDDRYPIPASRKLAFQTVIAVLVVSGFGITATAWIGVPHVAEVLSILWIVAVVNAYNMFDHADGLAAGAGVAALAALALGQMAVGEWFVPALALVTAGALAGFLVHNLPPARLFLGDAGSMPVGFVLASLAIAARYYFPEQGTSRYVVLVPLAVLAVPLFDAACVTIGRIARGRSPLVGDATSHLGHRLLARGWSPRAAAALATGAAAATGAASILLYRLSGWALLVPAGVVTAVLAILLYVRRAPAEVRP